MNILKTILVAILVVTSLSSCSKDEANANDNFYVKYVISSNYPGIFSNWSVTTPEGKYTKNDYQTRHWEQTYGPVKKGFRCDVQVGNGGPNIEIYVSKNQEPFAIKTTRNGGSASYTIDF
jgi:hypothetical protein